MQLAQVPASAHTCCRRASKLLPNSKVIKAFNTTFSANLITLIIDGKRTEALGRSGRLELVVVGRQNDLNSLSVQGLFHDAI